MKQKEKKDIQMHMVEIMKNRNFRETTGTHTRQYNNYYNGFRNKYNINYGNNNQTQRSERNKNVCTMERVDQRVNTEANMVRVNSNETTRRQVQQSQNPIVVDDRVCLAKTFNTPNKPINQALN